MTMANTVKAIGGIKLVWKLKPKGRTKKPPQSYEFMSQSLNLIIYFIWIDHVQHYSFEYRYKECLYYCVLITSTSNAQSREIQGFEWRTQVRGQSRDAQLTIVDITRAK